jgi:acetylornithine deacetylase/succinyl-diaminopimelate desuccinylase-like protein
MKKELPKDWENDLFELLQIQSDNRNGITDCANYLFNYIKKMGLEVIIDTEYSNPIIVARTKYQYTANLLFYSHFDVKPSGDTALWNTSPFVPTIKNNRIYCRGSGDAKGQVFALLKGLQKVSEEKLNEDLGISIILEGGEENGSIGLAEICLKYKEFLKSKLTVILDSHWIKETPIVGLGCRGQLSFLLQYKEKKFDNFLHAGNYGGVYNGAAFELIKIINEFLNHSFIKEIFCKGNFDESNTKSAITICGINSGLIERSIIPNEGICHIDMRLVNINEDQLIKFIKHYFEIKNTVVTIRQYEKSFTSTHNINYKNAIISAIGQACGCPPICVNYIGAYLPMSKLDVLNAPQYVVPIAQYDENNHAPNENILVEHIFYGVDMVNNIYLNICSVFRRLKDQGAV